ncbi:MAG: M28 family peptidase [Planctomycetota bacterium]
MLWMPGSSYHGPPAQPNGAELEQTLRAHVVELADRIGPRHVGAYDGLVAAEQFIAAQMSAAGYQVAYQEYRSSGRTVRNIEVEIAGSLRAAELLVIGAHYDSCEDTPAANDNASGVAALLELARRFHGKRPLCTLRFVAFVNEEPPHFQTSQMGSLVYARRSQERGERIVGMVSLETIGYFSDEPKSQKYPPIVGWLYPSVGNFIGFVSDTSSRKFLRSFVGAFRAHAKIPSVGAPLPGAIPGVGWSDHWSFWQAGYPAIMVTDTAPFRYPHYHEPTDTPEKLDYRRMALVVEGVEQAIEELASRP